MNQDGKARRENQAADEVQKDPVCGMDVLQDSAFGKLDYDGQTYYFCGEPCINRFKAEPARYAKRRSGNSSRFSRLR